MRNQVGQLSLEAWRSIQTETDPFGSTTLHRTQKRVLDALHEAKRPVTGREIAHYKRIDGAWKRLPELETKGLAKRCGSRVCSISKRTATAWMPATK